MHHETNRTCAWPTTARRVAIATIVIVALAAALVGASARETAAGTDIDAQLRTLMDNVEAPDGVPDGLMYDGAEIAVVGTTTLWGFPDEHELKYNVVLCTDDSVEAVGAHYDSVAPAFSPNRVSVDDGFFRCPDNTAVSLVIPAAESGYAALIEQGNEAMVANLPPSILLPSSDDLLISVTDGRGELRLDMNYFLTQGATEPVDAIESIFEAMQAAGASDELGIRDDRDALFYQSGDIRVEISAQQVPNLRTAGGEVQTMMTYIIVERTGASSAPGGGATGGTTPADAAIGNTPVSAGDGGGSSNTMLLLAALISAVVVVGGGGLLLRRGAFAGVPASPLPGAGSPAREAKTDADAPDVEARIVPVWDEGEQQIESSDDGAIVLRMSLGDPVSLEIEEETP